MKTLLVDDEDDIRQMLAAFCRREGCDVTEAANGMEAMREYWAALADEAPFRFVVLDLALPRMDGISTAKRMRSAEGDVPGLPRTYIFGYTGQGQYLKSEGTLTRAGFDSVIIKPGTPVEIADLIAKVREGLDGEPDV